MAFNLKVVSSTLISKERVEGVLQDLFGREFIVEEVKFDALKGIKIFGLRIPAHGGRYDFLSAREVKITYSKAKLLEGELVLEEIEFVSPVLKLLGEPLKRGPIKAKPVALPQIIIRDGRLCFSQSVFFQPGWTQTLEKVNLRLHPFTQSRYVIEGEGNAGLFGRWQVRGELDLEQESLHLTGFTREINLGAPLVARLSDTLKSAWDRYQPQGPVKLGVNLSYQTGRDTPLDFTVIVDCQGTEMTFIGFPYKISNITGQIEMRESGALLKNLTGSHGPVKISLGGQTQGYDKEAAFKVKLDIENLSLDEELYNALGEDLKEVWKNVNPAGIMDVKCEITHPVGAEQPVQYHTRLFCQDVQFAFSGFPYSLQKVKGEVEFSASGGKSNQIKFKYLTGQHNKSQVRIDGELNGFGKEAGYNLSIEAKDVELNDYALKDAFDKLIKGGGQLWKQNQPEGPVNLALSLARPDGPEEVVDTRLLIECQGNNFKYGKSAYPFSEIKGQVEYISAPDVEPHLILKQLKAQHNKSQFEISGKIFNPTSFTNPSPDERIGSGYELEIKGNDLLLEDIKDFLPDALKALITQMNFVGLVDVSLRLTQHNEDPTKTPCLEYLADIKLTDGTLNPGLVLDGLNGNITIKGEIQGEHHHAAGSIKLNQMKLEGKRFENVSIRFMQEGDRISFYHIEGSAYKGFASGFFVITLPESEYYGKVSLTGVDLKEFIRDTFIAGRDISGTLSGEMGFKGKGRDIRAIEGQGHMLIMDGQLWDVPIFFAVLNVSSLFKRPVFHEGKVRFSLKDSLININRIKFISKPVELKGKGTIKFDGSLDLEFTAKLDSPLPFVPPLIKLVQKLYSIKIEGTFRNPTVGGKTFSPLSPGKE